LLLPSFSLENKLINTGLNFIAGTDEVGRGAWAGPVTAAAVILNPKKIPNGINDSKKLTKNKRNRLSDEIIATSISYSVIHISVFEIDKINILEASMLAMRNAALSLDKTPSHILVDGNKIPTKLNCPATAIVKGDNLSLTIAAASILAKVARDQIMEDLAQDFPKYGWETNVGYGTKAHIQGISQYGITPHHRRSFKPIHKML
tara:strand:+ start:217 stop:828 length:612 start_codon:yes stop_codon:yes gene_type:complete